MNKSNKTMMLFVVIGTLILCLGFMIWILVSMTKGDDNIEYTKFSDQQLIESEDTGKLFFSTYDGSSLSAKKFDGIHTMQEIVLESGVSVLFEIEIETKEGEAFLYIISPSKEIIKKFKGDYESFILNTTEDGEYIIKAVGNNFNGKLSIL